MEVSYESMLLCPFVTSPLTERQTSALFKVLDDSYAFINCITNSRVSKLNVSRLVKRSRFKRNFYWLIVSSVYFCLTIVLKSIFPVISYECWLRVNVINLSRAQNMFASDTLLGTTGSF